MSDLKIRFADAEDAEAILFIYAPYVERTAITFEYEVPTVEEFRQRIERTLEKYPYLVAELDGRTVGYAYAGAFVGRAAYDWSAALSIYIDQNCRRQGIGGKLYRRMENILRDMGVVNLYSCVAYPLVEDEYLTRNSVEFHHHLGFKTVGHFHQCAYKFDRWYDMVWMEKFIGDHRMKNDRLRHWHQTIANAINA